MKEHYLILNSFLIVVSLLFGAPVHAQIKIGNAQWIGLFRMSGDTNVWTVYRKNFELRQLPGKVIATIATDSKYWLWINGETGGI